MPPKKTIVPIVDGRFVAFAHDLDLVVHVWTIDEADEMSRLLDLGVDGIMTDRPSVLKDVLVQRGQWVGVTRVEMPLTPLDFLTRARRLFPDREGVVEWHDGERPRGRTRQFAGRADRLAHLLTGDLGVRPGDRVAWLCGNTHELLEAYYGVLLAGAILLPLNIRLAPAELRFVLDDAGAAVLFRHPSLARSRPRRAHRGARRRLRGRASRRSRRRRSPLARVDERAPAELFYTSGSTGRPKGALLTHRGLYLHAVHGALTVGHLRRTTSCCTRSRCST